MRYYNLSCKGITTNSANFIPNNLISGLVFIFLFVVSACAFPISHSFPPQDLSVKLAN